MISTRAGLVRMDFPPVLHTYALHALLGLWYPESSCCIEAMIVFKPTLPRPPRFWSQLKFDDP